jgi:hypothetical protein
VVVVVARTVALMDMVEMVEEVEVDMWKERH